MSSEHPSKPSVNPWRMKVGWAFFQLSPAMQEVLYLNRQLGKPIDQVARELELEEREARKLLSRALIRLSRLLEQESLVAPTAHSSTACVTG